MIEIDGVSFVYRAGQPDAVPALADLNLRIEPRQLVAIIGHNGSGKSTLAKLLTALQYPTAGQIRIDGIPVDARHRWDIRERVSIVFQDPDDQLVATRVLDDVAFGPENLGLPRPEIQRRVETALAALKLTGMQDRLIADLSLGDKQRVAIAGALAMRPRYLILDEPTSYLTATLAGHLLETVRDLHREQGMGVLHITHAMAEAVHFDRVIVLNEGRVVLDGPPRDVFSHADLLRSIRLDVPLPVSLAARLREAGVPVEGAPLTPKDLCRAIASLPHLALAEGGC